MGNDPSNLKTIIYTSPDGWNLGKNENPDITASLAAAQELKAENPDVVIPTEDDFYIMVSPTGKCYSGKQASLMKLLGNDPAAVAWRKHNA